MTPRELARVVRAALSDLDLARRTRDAVDRAGLGARGDVRLVAVGKAAAAMAAGAYEALGAAVGRGVVVTTDGTDGAIAVRAARLRGAVVPVVLHAAHPLPDARSVAAAGACLEVAARDPNAPRAGALLVLVSGGASSLVCAPAPGVTLAQKRAVVAAMLASGADVRAINVVRKHLSRVKGGGLARAAWPDPTATIVASDVIDGAAHDVGSGPSLPDPTSVAAARRLLARHAPRFADLPLVATLSPRAARARAVAPPRIVTSPEELARVAAGHFAMRGYEVVVLAPSTAPAEEIAAEMVRHAHASGPGTVFVRAAEPGVEVTTRRPGRGGRASHVAALVGRALAPGSAARFGAFATDGVDGASGTGGAIVDARFARRAEVVLGRGALDRAIARFDTGPLHVALGTALPARPTGHNLADLHVLVIGGRRATSGA